MTVKELIEELQKVDPDLRVISPKDDEGNGYRWPTCVDDDTYLRPDEAEAHRPEYLYSKADIEEEAEEYEIDPSSFVQVVYVG